MIKMQGKQMQSKPVVEEKMPDRPQHVESLWKWFHPVNYFSAFTTFCVVLGSYVYTLQPTVGLEDSGELITGAYRIGVPHPPGYPTWSILGKLFSLLIPIGDPAFRVNLVSAVVGAIAAGILTLILSKTADMIFGEAQAELGTHHMNPLLERFGLTVPRLLNALCAIPPGILFAFTPGTWSQCTIAEAYPLNVFNMALIVVLSFVLMFNPQRRDVMCWIAFVFGLGIVNHQTIVVLVFSIGWLAFATMKSSRQMRIRGADFYTIAVIFFVVCMIFGIVGSLASHAAAAAARGAIYTDLDKMVDTAKASLPFLFIIGFIVWFWLDKKPYEHFVLTGMNAMFLLMFTMFMFSATIPAPIRSLFRIGTGEFRMLPFDGAWGTVPVFSSLIFNFFVGFCGPFVIYLVVIYIVNKIVFNDTEWWKLVASFFGGLAFYLYLPLASAGNPQMNWARARTIEGFWHSILRGQYEKPSFARPVSYFLAQVKLYLLDTWDQYPMVLIFAFVGVAMIIVMWNKPRVRDWMIYVFITLFAGGILMVVLMNPKLDITSQYINRVFFILGHAGLGLLVGYGVLLVVSGIFPLARKSAEMKMVGLGLGGVLVAFGALFIFAGARFASILSKLKAGGVNIETLSDKIDKLPEELQALYRVIHISPPPAHATVFLVGFGCVFAAVGGLMLLGLANKVKPHVASVLMTCLLMVTPFISAIENWGEVNLRQKYFGYIFGIEMLKVCEPDTIFFGGTDPGRFVPEYLIGCNQFRGDIWLITQNGLADATYMNTLRDRYCKVRDIYPWWRTFLRTVNAEHEDPLRKDPDSLDPKRGTIYIPSQQDFERAFQIYIQDVEDRKKRGEPIEEDVIVQNGKISVGGVSGVMRLNGILAKMIFEENTNTHTFYVEESYVINWMYPYLKPAGLIMQLCKDKVTLTPDIVKADMEYWANLTNVFDNGGVLEYDDVVALYWRELKEEFKTKPTATRDDAVKAAWTRAAGKSISIGVMPYDALPSKEYLRLLYDQCKAGQELEFIQDRGKIVVRKGGFADDEPAQKSFSKARSAAAGVYEHHGMWKEAEVAYLQALWLYPQSAEAYMRLASMYMKINRFDDALTLAEDYKKKDPLNDRVDGMIGAIRGARDQNLEYMNLAQQSMSATNMDAMSYIKLAQMHEARGNAAAAQQIYDQLLSKDSPVTNKELYGYLLSEFGRRKDMDRTLRSFERIVQIDPKDWQAWLELAKFRFSMGATSVSFDCIETAIKADPEKARVRLMQDDQFQMMRTSPDKMVKTRFENYIK